MTPPKTADISDLYAAGIDLTEMLLAAEVYHEAEPAGTEHRHHGSALEDEQPPPPDDDAPWTDAGHAASGGDAADDEEREPSGWEAPLAIGDAFAPSPFPLASLPPVLRAFVEGLAENTATPPDMAAMAALGVCATTLAGRVRGCAWWSEPVNLFVAVAMEPGSRKSAVLGEVVQPLLDAEKCEFARLAPDIQAAKMKIKILDARVRAAESAAAKAEADTERDSLTAAAIKAAQDRDAAPLPVAPRYFCDDVTPERLVGMLAEHGGRMALISAEGGPFAMMGGRYSDGVPNIDVILKGHAGDAIRVDRVGRPPEQIDSPALSMILAIQPDVVRGLAENPGFRGRGLLGRFLYAIPRSTVGTRPAQAPPMPATARAAYRGLVRRLLALPIPSSAPPELQFDESACLALEEFVAALEPRLGEAGDLGHMADWAGKLSGAVVRIAAILHMVERAERTHPWEFRVGVDTVRDAITIGHYLTEHARAAFAMMGADPELTEARHLLAWVAAHGGEQFVERDAYNGNRGRFGRMDAFRKAVAILVAHGYLRLEAVPRPAGQRGRKPSPRYAVNPMWTPP